MLFSSITFLYYFLPLVLLVYFISPHSLKNAVLLIASLVFYAWGEPLYVFLLIGTIAVGYVFGLLIDRFRGDKRSRLMLIGSIVVIVGLLFFFKYADFLISNINQLLNGEMPLLHLALPLGISFYSFQILSYTVDLYRGKVKVQRNPFKFATYVALFPQLVAGPIVRYETIEEELSFRVHSFENFSEGATRFVIGLAKKVLLANVLGQLVETYKASAELSVLFAWLYIAAFALQIYFDFSGYSDMAIGLGRMFGFHFAENFNYPYISRSVSEFWRRWHISLGSWFRDYLYIPMGGNRVKVPRHLLNILVVWLLTGFWHGAGWTFISWGIYFAILLAIEKYLLAGVLAKTPAWLKHILTLILVLSSFVIFDAVNLAEAFSRLGQLFGITAASLSGQESLYYLNSYFVPLLLGILGATPLPALVAKRLPDKLMLVLRPLFIIVLLLLVTAYLVDGSFNPFIYFRF